MLWLTKPEYAFPSETSFTFPETNADSAGRKVKSHIAELWYFLLQHKATHGAISIMDDAVSLSLTCLLIISTIRHFVKPVIEYFWQESIAFASATAAISWTNCVPTAFCSDTSPNPEH